MNARRLLVPLLVIIALFSAACGGSSLGEQPAPQRLVAVRERSPVRKLLGRRQPGWRRRYSDAHGLVGFSGPPRPDHQGD